MNYFRSWLMVSALVALQGSTGCNCCCSPKQSKSQAFNPTPMGSAAVPTSTTTGGSPAVGRTAQPVSNPGSTDVMTPGTMPRAGGVATNAGLVNMTAGSVNDPVKSWDANGAGAVTQTSGVTPQTPMNNAPAPTTLPVNNSPVGGATGQLPPSMGVNTLPPTPDLPANTSSRYIPVSTNSNTNVGTFERNQNSTASLVSPPQQHTEILAPLPAPSAVINPPGSIGVPSEVSAEPATPGIPVTPVEPRTPSPTPMPPG